MSNQAKASLGERLAMIRKLRENDLERVKRYCKPGSRVIFYPGEELARKGVFLLRGIITETFDRWFVLEAKTPMGGTRKRVVNLVDLMLWEAEIGRRKAGLGAQRMYVDFILLGDSVGAGLLRLADFQNPDDEKRTKEKPAKRKGRKKRKKARTEEGARVRLIETEKTNENKTANPCMEKKIS